MKLLKNICCVCAALLLCGMLCADPFSDGEKLFRENKPEEAIPLFVQALNDAAVNPSVYIYLGLAYYQTGRLQNSLDTFLAGAGKSGTDKRVLYYNAGNTAFKMGDFKQAEDLFSLASAADPAFSAALLNKANAQLQQDKLQEAAASYTSYLDLEPASVQADNIRKVIALIAGEMEVREQEKVRLAQEAERMKAEEERIAAEKEAQRLENERVAAEQAAAEAEQMRLAAERRKQLLEEVSASLQAAGAENVSAGTEGVMEYNYESELD